jgi:hypothetical protein
VSRIASILATGIFIVGALAQHTDLILVATYLMANAAYLRAGEKRGSE